MNKNIKSFRKGKILDCKDIKVSIYTTILNIKNCPYNCVENILSQSHSNFEWIIVYNKESDKKNFSRLTKNDARIKYIKGKSGRCNKLRLAVLNTNSDFIFNQDYDDIPTKDRIKYQLEVLLSNANIASVAGWYEAHYIDNDVFAIHNDPDSEFIIKKKLCYMLPFAHTFCGFRKSLLLNIGNYPLEPILEDGIIWAKFISQGYQVKILKKNIGKHFIYKASNFGKKRLKINYEFKLFIARYKIRKILKLPIYYDFLNCIKLIYAYLPSYAKKLIRSYSQGYKYQKIN